MATTSSAAAPEYCLLRQSHEYQLLRQIPGIGPINALTIIAEAGDFRRFHHHRQFLKFCGLDLSTQQSGQYRGQTCPSKFGNARLRRTLWIAGQVAIRQRENGFRHKFERYIARDRDNQDRSAPKGDDRYYRQDGASCTLSSKAVLITGPSLRGGCQEEELLSVRAVRSSLR